MYKILNHETIQRLTDNAFIPQVAQNRDYQEYLLWVEKGNTPEPCIATDEDSSLRLSQGYTISCSSLQFRKNLSNYNIRDIVEKTIQSSNNYDIKDVWEYALEFTPDSSVIIFITELINQDKDFMIEFIQEASSLGVL